MSLGKRERAALREAKARFDALPLVRQREILRVAMCGYSGQYKATDKELREARSQAAFDKEASRGVCDTKMSTSRKLMTHRYQGKVAKIGLVDRFMS